MDFVTSHVQYIGKSACYVISDWLSISFQIMNIGYRKTEKFDISTPLIFITISGITPYIVYYL